MQYLSPELFRFFQLLLAQFIGPLELLEGSCFRARPSRGFVGSDVLEEPIHGNGAPPMGHRRNFDR